MIGATPLERLKSTVIERTGHAYYADKDALLYEHARERMRIRGGLTLDAYLAVLEAGSETEWRALEDAITIGETYFFRYPDHFETMRRRILPALIAARQDSKVLRIWSIGCSTGAEPYSIAIVMRELLGDEVDAWRISIIGGDISEKALSAARAGRYNAWALRTLGPEERARYFDRDGSLWVLKREYRAMVRFERQNLLEILTPDAPISWDGFDLVLCRNVLIYFSPAQAVAVAAELRKRLAADGELILGHAEATLAGDPSLLTVSVIPSEFRRALAPPTSTAPWQPLDPPDLPLSMRQPLRAPTPQPKPAANAEDAIDDVQHLADAGAYEQAEQLCRKLIAQHPTSARLHYYDAILHQVSENLRAAEAALKKALYLDRSFTLAHHRLGMLLLRLGRRGEARRSLLSAVRLTEEASPSAEIAEGQGISAGELGAVLRQQIEALDEAA